MLSALPGWAIGQIPAVQSMPGMTELLTAASVLICWPIMFLSQLDFNSAAGLLSGRILSSLLRCPFSWAFFYLECAFVIAICGGATYLVARHDLISPIWMIALYVAGLLLCARLLGRLAWRLAEA
jgi:hypothetical protein